MDVPNSGAIFTLGKSYLAENTQSYFYIKNDPIKRLISGPQQSAVICESGRLFAWGENHYGQLGIGGSSLNTKVSNANANNNIQNSDIITKPTCVKSLKTLGLKISDIAYGNNWAVILAHSNELFFCGRNIFPKAATVSQNFTETTVANEKCSIIRKPFRLEEFDDCLSHNEETENFITILAGNEHFAVMTSFGRLIGWGSNQSHQLGTQNVMNGNEEMDTDSGETLLQPFEIVLDAPVRQFTCGPESTLVLTESGNLFITGRLNELVFTEFVILQKNLSPAEQIIFMHISKASEIFIVTNAGNIFRSMESVRNKSLIFQRFYDYDSEENGPIWKMLKGFSFYAVLTKANKFYTTFSESGHHLKTFREISKFKNLRLLDMAVGDQHILVHGIPRSSKLSATIGPGGEHRFMSRTYVMPTQLVNGDGSSNNNSINNNSNANENEKSMEMDKNGDVDMDGDKDENTNQSHVNNNIAGNSEEYSSEINQQKSPEIIAQKAESSAKTNEDNSSSIENGDEKEREHESHSDINENENESQNKDQRREFQNDNQHNENEMDSSNLRSPAESVKSRRSGHSIKFDDTTIEKSASSDKLLRPRTPYPESSTTSTPQTIKKTPLRNYSYEAAMKNEYLEQTSPPIGESLENIPESIGGENASAPITAIVSSPTPPTEEDEQLTVEINTTTDALDHTIVLNEIRFINNGVDVTANVKQSTTESESDCDATEEEDGESSVKALGIVEKSVTVVSEKAAEARRQAEGMIDKLQQEIVEKVDQAAELKNDAQDGASKVIDDMGSKLKEVQSTVATTSKNMVHEAVDTVGENVKRVANDARQAVENIGQGALKVASDTRNAVDNAFSKVASETKQAVGVVTTKIGTEMQEAKDNLTAFLQPQTVTPKQTNDDEPDDEPSCKDNGGDDERTTASVNSNHTSSAGGGNPFESNNPFESGNPFENDIDENLGTGKQALRDEVNSLAHKEIDHGKGRIRQFFDDVRAKSKDISCRNEKSIRIDDEPPRYSVSDQLNSGNNQNGNDFNGANGTNSQNTSKNLQHAHAAAAAAAMANCDIVIVSSSPNNTNSNNTNGNNNNNNNNNNASNNNGNATTVVSHQQQQQQQQQAQSSTISTEMPSLFNMHLSAASAEAHAAAQAATMAVAQAAAAQAAAAEQQQQQGNTTGGHQNILQQHPLAHLVAATAATSPVSLTNDAHFTGSSRNGGNGGSVEMNSNGHNGNNHEKPFLCNVCDRRFRQLSTLTNHVKIHTGEKPYKCNVCDKTFRQSSTLTNHLKIHTGEKPFTCSYCPKHFRQLSTLTNHLKIHTGEKPFECAVCKKQFRQSSTLNNHIKIHVMDKVYVPVKIKTEEEEG